VKPFERIVAEHGPTVLRVCRAILGHADADDAWSETFFAAMRAYSDLPQDANVEAWLVTIAHRKTVDALRASGRRATPVDNVPEHPAAYAPDRPDHADLYEALRRLPDKQRQAVAYHHLAGLSHREIAAVLGGTEEAARRASADGIKTLRRTYQQEGALP
jgi:RNA polymerase sigma factor (sigma-70 family)